MRKLIPVLGLLVGLGACARPGSAFEEHPPRASERIDTFVALERVGSRSPYRLVLRGRLAGKSAPAERTYWAPGDAAEAATTLHTCQDLAVLVMHHPGQYQLEVAAQVSGWDFHYLAACQVVRIQRRPHRSDPAHSGGSSTQPKRRDT